MKKTNAETAFNCGKEFGGGCVFCRPRRYGRISLLTDSK